MSGRGGTYFAPPKGVGESRFILRPFTPTAGGACPLPRLGPHGPRACLALALAALPLVGIGNFFLADVGRRGRQRTHSRYYKIYCGVCVVMFCRGGLARHRTRKVISGSCDATTTCCRHAVGPGHTPREERKRTGRRRAWRQPPQKPAAAFERAARRARAIRMTASLSLRFCFSCELSKVFLLRRMRR